jgi:hypothetical protein
MSRNKTIIGTARVLAAVAMGLFVALPSGAQTLSASLDGKGSAVVVPYYTVNDDWRTLLNITNTTANSLAVKVRFLEARNGRDILNFTIALAPGDAWAGWLSRNEEGRPVMKTSDRSCTTPFSDRGSAVLVGDEFAYSKPEVFGVLPGFMSRHTDYSETNGSIARMSEGHVEILVMGEAVHDGRVLDVPWDAEHENGEPRDCLAVSRAFSNTTDSWNTGQQGPIPGTEGSGDPEARGGANYGPIMSAAPLKVNAGLVNQATGTAIAIQALHLAGWGVGRNLVVARPFPWNLEPTLASHEGLWSTSGLAAVTEALATVAVENEWASNPATGASTDWVLTFPTKRFDVDESALNSRAACSRWRNSRTSGGVPVGEGGAVFDGHHNGDGHAPRMVVDDADAVEPERLCPNLGFADVFQNANDGRADIAPVRYRFFDRATQSAERIAADDETLGPLPYVVNVLPIGSGGSASALGSLIALPLDSDVLANAPANGWLRLDFPAGEATTPYPMAGFAFKLRDFGNPALNFSQAVPHSPERP